MKAKIRGLYHANSLIFILTTFVSPVNNNDPLVPSANADMQNLIKKKKQKVNECCQNGVLPALV